MKMTTEEKQHMEQFCQFHDFHGATLEAVEKWFDRGDGAAVYELVDGPGDLRVVSFGSDKSLEPGENPPLTLDEFGIGISRTYKLNACYRPGWFQKDPNMGLESIDPDPSTCDVGEEDIMPRIKNQKFRCDCGCNVFRHVLHPKRNYLRCNSCHSHYIYSNVTEAEIDH